MREEVAMKISEKIKEKVTRQQWEHWFSDFAVREISESEKKVVFEVGNMFIKGYIENKFAKVLLRALSETLGAGWDFTIEYATIDNNEPELEESGALVKKRPVILTPLNKKFSFSNFVVDEFNQFAYTILLESSKKLGTYNPIFIYSEAGMGKTHLVQAFGNYMLKNNPHIKFMYLTSEQFMNELFAKIKAGKTEEFREKYRKQVDILVIDDIQFLAGKQGVQIELFHTFNSLYEAGKQIIICSDRPPKELGGFQDRVLTRFQMGVTAQIKTPSPEALYKIALKVMEEEKVEIDDAILRFISNNVVGSIRTFKGAIIKLIAYQSMYGVLTVSNVKELLKDILITSNDTKDYVGIIANVFGCSKEDLLSSKKDKLATNARQIGMYLAYKKFGLSIRKIGDMFNKSHPTVLNAIKKVESELSTNKMLNSYLAAAEKALNGIANTDNIS